jgi:peptide/nickel transport system substrate-binding protein
MKKSQLLLASFILIAALLMAACGGSTSTDESGPQSAPEATPSTSGDSGSTDSGSDDGTGTLSLDPANNGSEAAGYVYETLVNGDGEGVLAESYTVSEDELDYIFNLRAGVTFHDGSALNADVVIANFSRWFDPEDSNRGSGDFAAWAENFGGFKGETNDDGTPKSIYDGIEKVNDLTVLVHLNKVDADFLSKLSNSAFSIVSADAFGGADGGSGPYQVGSVSGSTATLEPFPGYWNAEAIPSGSMDAAIE